MALPGVDGVPVRTLRVAFLQQQPQLNRGQRRRMVGVGPDVDGVPVRSLRTRRIPSLL